LNKGIDIITELIVMFMKRFAVSVKRKLADGLKNKQMMNGKNIAANGGVFVQG
jgi:hypothetical protein